MGEFYHAELELALVQAMAGLRAEGVQFHEVSAEDGRVIAERLKPKWQKWADAGGPVAQEVLDIALETLGY